MHKFNYYLYIFRLVNSDFSEIVATQQFFPLGELGDFFIDTPGGEPPGTGALLGEGKGRELDGGLSPGGEPPGTGAFLSKGGALGRG